MPKVSKDTASTHQAFPGYVDAYEQEIGGWTVSIESNFIDMDEAPFFTGAPNDQCQANHVGYVLKGKFGVRTGEGAAGIGNVFLVRSTVPTTHPHTKESLLRILKSDSLFP